MNLLKDDVSQLIKKLAIPASVGTLFQTLYTLVDTFYAGKISPEALSALSKSFPIYFLIIATSIGVTVAGTSLIGSSIGEKNEKNVLGYFTNIILYSVIISIIVSIIGFSFSEKLFLTMNSSREVITLGLEYTNVIFYGTILFILVVALNSFLHAEGDTVTYRNALILSFFLNILLNPIFIFGFLFIPAFGVAGIGYATLIAQFLSLIIVLIKLLKNKRIKEITFQNFKIKFFYIKKYFFPINANYNSYSWLLNCCNNCIYLCCIYRRICRSWLWSSNKDRAGCLTACIGDKYSNNINYCTEYRCEIL
jgi:putative MATE family efflux protein